jgi:hypothetical protein
MKEWNNDRLVNVRRLIANLFATVTELQEEFAADRRKFTLDGHLVGSIGEVVAAYAFELELLTSSSSVHDAKTADGRLVQIKLTAGNRIAMYNQPDHLIVLHLNKLKTELVYNGPGEPAWNRCGQVQKNGERSVGLTKLRELNRDALPKIEQVREFPI